MSERSRERAKLRNQTALMQQRESAAAAVALAEEAHAAELASTGEDEMDCSHMRPVYGTIFVHWPKQVEKVGSIIMPQGLEKQDQLMVRPAVGKVLAVGPGHICQETGQTLPMICKVGDQVIFGQRAAVPFEQGGKQVWMMSQMNIYAVISPVAQVLG